MNIFTSTTQWETKSLQEHSIFYSQLNLIPYEGLLHSLCGYPTITPLHYITTFPSHTYDLICHSMSCYDKGEGSTPIYRMPWLIWFCDVSIFYTLLYKISNSQTFLILSTFFIFLYFYHTKNM